MTHTPEQIAALKALRGARGHILDEPVSLCTGDNCAYCGALDILDTRIIEIEQEAIRPEPLVEIEVPAGHPLASDRAFPGERPVVYLPEPLASKMRVEFSQWEFPCDYPDTMCADCPAKDGCE